jgi:Protein of unknown function (DUF1236)
MRRAALTIIALFIVSGLASAHAATVNLTAEDTHIIKEIVLKETSFPRLATADYKVGDQAPPSVRLQAFPPVISDRISSTRSHRFFVSGQKIVVVDPKDNTIVEIIE